jgi:hypothetical protein
MTTVGNCNKNCRNLVKYNKNRLDITKKHMKLTEMTPKQFCDAKNACNEGRKFALKYQSMSEVWDNCPKVDWLLWITDKTGRPDDRTLRLFAVWCARNTPLPDGRKTGDLITDPRSLFALDVAERFANGKASAAELAAAGDAAWYAARDAGAAAGYAADKAQATQFRAMVKNPFTQ